MQPQEFPSTSGQIRAKQESTKLDLRMGMGKLQLKASLVLLLTRTCHIPLRMHGKGRCRNPVASSGDYRQLIGSYEKAHRK